MIFAPVNLHEVPVPASVRGGYDGVTYYDQPAVNPTRYGWLISAYFYAGGVASASAFLAAVMDSFGSPEDRAAVRAGRYTALLGALVSPPLLIADLHTPQRWYNMLRIFRRTSAMSIGSWALSSFGLFSGLAAAGQALEDFLGWRVGGWLARLAGLPAALAGGVVAIYTGTLLAATNIPIWASAYPFLSSLFASSAASTAAAALSLFTPARAERTHRRLTIFAIAAGLSELFFAGRIGWQWRRQRVDAPIRDNPVLRLGWQGGVFGLAILLPLTLHVVELFFGRPSRRLARWSAIFALIGGFLLRSVIVFADKPSARRPEDYLRLSRGGNR